MSGTAVPSWLGRLFEGLDELPARAPVGRRDDRRRTLPQLYAGGVRHFHFYTLNRAELSYAICHLLGVRAKARGGGGGCTLHVRTSAVEAAARCA